MSFRANTGYARFAFHEVVKDFGWILQVAIQGDNMWRVIDCKTAPSKHKIPVWKRRIKARLAEVME